MTSPATTTDKSGLQCMASRSQEPKFHDADDFISALILLIVGAALCWQYFFWPISGVELLSEGHESRYLCSSEQESF